MATTTTITTKKRSSFVLLSCLSAVLEYYDFIIYGMMIAYLSEVFFPDNTATIATLKTFSVLAVGYLVRPLGGSVFGLMSDLYGRKRALLTVMFVMACATLGIGLLPTYQQAGILAPILLTLARALQGVSFGAEMPNITTLIKEHITGGQSGKYFGFVIASTSIGSLLASAVVYLVTQFFSQTEIVEYAWRLPFFMGGTIALLIFIMRTQLEESPEFLASQQKSSLHQTAKPLLLDLFRHHRSTLVFGGCITLFFSYLIILSLYLPVYLTQYYGYEKPDIFKWISLSLLISVVAPPLFGTWFERFNRVRVIPIITLLFLPFLYGGLQLLRFQSSFALALFLCVYQVFIASYSTNLLAVLSDIFPLSVRVTGIGLCYNLAYSLASVTPLLLTAFIKPDTYFSTVWLFSCFVVSVVIMAAVYWLRTRLQSNIKLNCATT